jgi:hypothetical protein
MYDGIAYRFEIRYEESRYSFDSCVEELEAEELFATLVQYFDIIDGAYRISL